MHALGAVPLGKGGRGKKGGLAAYAERIGRDRPNVIKLRCAAEVFASLKHVEHYTGLAGKAFHLAAIHKADEPLWPALVAKMLDAGWTVKEAKEAVEPWP